MGNDFKPLELLIPMIEPEEHPEKKEDKRKRAGRHRQTAEGFRILLDALADGQPRKLVMRNHYYELPGLPRFIDSVCAVEYLSPFYRVERDYKAGTVTIHQRTELRDQIADWAAGKNMPEVTGVGALARRLRDGIKAREEDFLQQRKAANWTSDRQLSTVFEHWLKWIKSELDAVLKD